MTTGQRTIVELNYEGVNITEDIAGDLLSFVWNDNESGKADDVEITLRNSHGRWSGDWFPNKGDVIKASITIESGGGERASIYCGRFVVDELSFSGPPSTLSIKAQSAPQGNDIRRTKMNKAWEDVSLQDICAAIAEKGGLTMIYDVSESFLYDRLDQRRESDLGFLNRVCTDEGLSLKITGEQLVVFSQEDYEAKAPVDQIVLGTSRVVSWSFDTQAYELYSKARVRYYDTNTGETVERTFTPPPQSDNPPYKAPAWVGSFMEGGGAPPLKKDV